MVELIDAVESVMVSLAYCQYIDSQWSKEANTCLQRQSRYQDIAWPSPGPVSEGLAISPLTLSNCKV